MRLTARSHAKYDAALVRAIVMLKFERTDPLGAWFAERLAEVARREGETLAAGVVVPVPLQRQPEREHGYNQAELIARPLAKRLGLPYRGLLLVRKRPHPEANTEPYRAVGARPWRFCHAAGQSG
jgi:predicted amidophosphoribosyltransferase